jgi:hypothetical protein
LKKRLYDLRNSLFDELGGQHKTVTGPICPTYCARTYSLRTEKRPDDSFKDIPKIMDFGFTREKLLFTENSDELIFFRRFLRVNG